MSGGGPSAIAIFEKPTKSAAAAVSSTSCSAVKCSRSSCRWRSASRLGSARKVST
jgi:hypothetical protein